MQIGADPWHRALILVPPVAWTTLHILFRSDEERIFRFGVRLADLKADHWNSRILSHCLFHANTEHLLYNTAVYCFAASNFKPPRGFHRWRGFILGLSIFAIGAASGLTAVYANSENKRQVAEANRPRFLRWALSFMDDALTTRQIYIGASAGVMGLQGFNCVSMGDMMFGLISLVPNLIVFTSAESSDSPIDWDSVWSETQSPAKEAKRDGSSALAHIAGFVADSEMVFSQKTTAFGCTQPLAQDESRPQKGLIEQTSEQRPWGMLYAPSGSYVLQGAIPIIIGRGPDVEIRLTPSYISLEHCILARIGTQVELKDLSTNGTFLNGLRLGHGNTRIVYHGDLIELSLGARLARDASANSFIFHELSTNRKRRRPNETEDLGPDRAGQICRWRRGHAIGSGRSGTVYLAMDEETGGYFAVKVMSVPRTGPRLASPAERELRVLSRLSHPHIVRLFGHVRPTPGELVLFLELVNGGSLDSLLVAFGSFTDHIARVYCRQILEGLVFLHARKIVHGDIKPSNILLTTQGHVKLSDFGEALLHQDESVVSGTPRWMSPERLIRMSTKDRCASPTTACDIWALGCVLFEMRTAALPWAHVKTDTHPMVLLSAIARDIGNDGDPGLATLRTTMCDEQLFDFVAKCLTHDPATRPTAEELLEHEFMKQTGDYVEMSEEEPELIDDITTVTTPDVRTTPGYQRDMARHREFLGIQASQQLSQIKDPTTPEKQSSQGGPWGVQTLEFTLSPNWAKYEEELAEMDN